MLKRLFAIAVALWLGLALSPAHATPPSTIRESVAVCDPWYPARCMAPNADGTQKGFASFSTASVTRPSNTTTYTANTAFANSTSAGTYLTFSGVCRAVGTTVLIPDIRVIDSANQTTKLSGVLWLFSVAPTPINDNATFNIASGDLTNIAAGPIAFSPSVASNQSAGASGSAVAAVVGTTYEAKCAAADTNLYGLIQAANAYVPVSGETLTVSLKTVPVN